MARSLIAVPKNTQRFDIKFSVGDRAASARGTESGKVSVEARDGVAGICRFPASIC